jgi:hypothetical protein
MYSVNHVGLVDEKKTKMENLQGELYKLQMQLTYYYRVARSGFRI